MMKSRRDRMPAERHKRSQNAPVVYTLVDEALPAVDDALMGISSRTEGEFGSPAALRRFAPLLRLFLTTQSFRALAWPSSAADSTPKRKRPLAGCRTLLPLGCRKLPMTFLPRKSSSCGRPFL